MAEIMIARRPGTVVINGQRRMVRKGVTTAHADHPIVRDHPRLWEPLKVTHSTPDQADEQDAAEAARYLAAECERLAAGLRERGIEAEDDSREGWLVDTVLAAFDRQTETSAADADPEPGYEPAADPAVETEPAGLTKSERAAIRAWAKEAGLDVAARGVIPPAVVEQYRAAHGG